MEASSMIKAKPGFTKTLPSDLRYKIVMKPEVRGTLQPHPVDSKPSDEARISAAGARLTALMTPGDMQEPLEFVALM
jgi:hypothetical protein